MSKRFTVTYSVCGTMTIEASNEEEARKIAENLPADKILEEVQSAIESDGYMVGDVEEEDTND